VHDVQGKDGRTPLHAAAVNGHVKTVQLLLDLGANVRAQNKFGETPVFFF
jgi:ankyrin repeat protein